MTNIVKLKGQRDRINLDQIYGYYPHDYQVSNGSSFKIIFAADGDSNFEWNFDTKEERDKILTYLDNQHAKNL